MEYIFFKQYLEESIFSKESLRFVTTQKEVMGQEGCTVFFIASCCVYAMNMYNFYHQCNNSYFIVFYC
jgi:hypothetical protein